MHRRLTLALALLTAAVACAAPAPYPVTVDSRNPGAPPIYAYQNNSRTFRATFTDGTNVSPTTGYTPYLAWYTNASSTGVVSAAVSVVNASNGVIDFTLAPTQLNHRAGRYVYEVGVKTNDVATTYRTGTFLLYSAPGAYAGTTAWLPVGNETDPVWSAASNLYVTGSVVRAEADTLQSVVNRGATVTQGVVVIDAANGNTNTFGGLRTILGRSVQSGSSSTATGDDSVAMGVSCDASAARAVALGYDCTASGSAALAAGNSSVASGSAAVALGMSASATHENSFVWASDTDEVEPSMGANTFCIAPAGGMDGVYINRVSLSVLVSNLVQAIIDAQP